jgi:hypothetical protein
MSLTTQNEKPSIEISDIEQVIMMGDLSKLTSNQRVIYYNDVCKSVGLNPMTRPLEYIVLNGRLTLYARKDATEQLRALKGVSIEKLEEKIVGDVYIVKATAKTRDGRTDTSTGAVAFGHLKGDAQANALMKAETKAKRRVTLSICGLGFLDEMEVETIPSAKTVKVDINTGEMETTLIQEIPKERFPSKSQIDILAAILKNCTEATLKTLQRRMADNNWESYEKIPLDQFHIVCDWARTQIKTEVQ